ncbi:MAG: DNA-formamidopyrimidine glycosylase family protein [Ferruginibacter sp.]
MPEGPSIIILKEAVQHFKGKKILASGGNAKMDTGSFKNKTVLDFKSWGKHFIICFKGVNIRIHFLLFGTYSLDEQTKPDRSLRLFLKFNNGTVYFYTCSIKRIEGGLDEIYDWSSDVMNESFDIAKARKKLKATPETMVCDVLLDQDVFTGVGNIIKNEVLYRIRLHPETMVGDIPPKKITELIKEARQYSFDFLKWKKVFELKKHWVAHTKKTCTRCDLPFIKKYCGKTMRRTFYCEKCQVKNA